MITDYMMNEDTLEGEDITMIEVEGHQIEEMTKKGVIQGVEGHLIEDPLMMMEDPLEWMDGPCDDGGPPGNGRPPR